MSKPWLAIAVSAIVLCACQKSSDDYAALEKRVAALEKQVQQMSEGEASKPSRSPARSVASVLPISHAPETAPAPASDDWEIVSVESRVTETNNSWSKYAWKLTIRNKSGQPQLFDAKIEFKDRDGFVVDDDDEYKLLVPANSEQTFTDYDLVNADVAGNIVSTSAKVRKRTS